MLDRLLGRAELKERIAALEEEKEHLERELEAEGDRRTAAVSARQDAQEEVNRLEDRIADLEGRLERVTEGETRIDYRRAETARGSRLESLLARLESVRAPGAGALTAMVEEGRDLPDDVREVFGEHAALVARAAPCLAVTDDAGLVSAALVPPVRPDAFVDWGPGFSLEREWFLPVGTFRLALVRADLFAVAEYDGRERRSFGGFESDVRGQHSKGGFSQSRFERRRDEQIDAHLDRCREALAGGATAPLYVVGDRGLAREFADLAAATAAVDATGEPEDALEDAFREFWTVRVYGI